LARLVGKAPVVRITVFAVNAESEVFAATVTGVVALLSERANITAVALLTT